jgi:hypothetical protein
MTTAARFLAIGCQGIGWGARIRTWDRGTKTRCLTTWLRPNARGLPVYGAASRVLARAPSAFVQEQRQERNDGEDADGDDREDADERDEDWDHGDQRL